MPDCVFTPGAGCLRLGDTFSLSLSDNNSLLALLILNEIQNGSTTGLVRSVVEPKWQRAAARWLAVSLDPLNGRFCSVSTQAEGLVCSVFVLVMSLFSVVEYGITGLMLYLKRLEGFLNLSKTKHGGMY